MRLLRPLIFFAVLLTTYLVQKNAMADEEAQCAVQLTNPNALARLDDIKTMLPDIEERMKRGLTVKWVHIFLIDEKDPENTVNQHAQCEILFDLWEEEYIVNKIDDMNLKQNALRKTFPNLSRALDECMKYRMVNVRIFEKNLKDKLTIVSIFNPISDDQLQKTRKWLAERGIGGKDSPILGRAVGAMMDMSQQKVWHRSCSVQQAKM